MWSPQGRECLVRGRRNGGGGIYRFFLPVGKRERFRRTVRKTRIVILPDSRITFLTVLRAFLEKILGTILKVGKINETKEGSRADNKMIQRLRQYHSSDTVINLFYITDGLKKITQQRKQFVRWHQIRGVENDTGWRKLNRPVPTVSRSPTTNCADGLLIVSVAPRIRKEKNPFITTINQSINPSINQSIFNWSPIMNQLIANQSIYQTNHHSIDQSIDQLTNQSIEQTGFLRSNQ